ncbi:MAG TPA: hypothetical protein VFI47_01550, partial [Acidimicrobiales bacterium]|nr:hypothetical protein [Acidimicrobiales bacterium]
MEDECGGSVIEEMRVIDDHHHLGTAADQRRAQRRQELQAVLSRLVLSREVDVRDPRSEGAEGDGGSRSSRTDGSGGDAGVGDPIEQLCNQSRLADAGGSRDDPRGRILDHGRGEELELHEPAHE